MVGAGENSGATGDTRAGFGISGHTSMFLLPVAGYRPASMAAGSRWRIRSSNSARPSHTSD
jgi:hypothetical protein